MKRLIKLFTKLTLVFSLVCYLAVSGMAVAHAFPSFGDFGNSMGSDTAEVMPNCHQEGLSSVVGDVSVALDSSNSVSPCKMFCSAMANVIPTEFDSTFSFVKPTIAVAFLSQNSLSRQLAVEPHPPK